MHLPRFELSGHPPGFSRTGRTFGAWHQSLQKTWIKLHLSPAPPSTAKSGAQGSDGSAGGRGEVERYLLEVRGLREESGLLQTAEA